MKALYGEMADIGITGHRALPARLTQLVWALRADPGFLARTDRVWASDSNDPLDRQAIQRGTALTANDLKKGIPSLATIGATAPFVGLLGTVIGVINAFHGISTTGSGGLGAVSGGISEALVETALGLVVAIPAVWFYNYLTGRIEYFNVEMDNSSSELVDYFIRKTA